MIRILGLDLKPARSGIARNYDRDGQPHLSTTAVGIGSVGDTHRKVAAIERAVSEAVTNRGGGILPDVAVIEGTFTKGTASDYGQIAVHYGVTRLLRRCGVPWVDVAPATLKVWATGFGRQNGDRPVTKRDVCAQIVATYGRLLYINPNDDDACDALALLTMGAAHYGLPVVDVDADDQAAGVPRKQWRSRALKAPNWPTPRG